ncbi:MAG: permease-like cell division protein FtsX [Patescibacteria group bacterium]
MMKHNFKKLLKAGWTNFRRNSYISVAVTGVMALVLMLLLGLISFQFLTARLVTSIQEKVDISTYFKIETPEDQILSVKKDLEKLPEVKSVAYVSRDQAQAEFKARHADNQLIQEALQQLENPFEATLNIRAQDPTKYEGIATFLENSKYRASMDKINYNENRAVIDKINSFASGLRLWGLIVTLVIAIIAMLITFNTIRLTIYNQKQEIEIMRLVGASNWHIRGPYLAEGAIYGFFAAVLSLVLFYPIVYLVSGKLGSFISDVDLFRYFLVNSWQIVLITLVVGILLGTLSSVIAIRKHLKI